MNNFYANVFNMKHKSSGERNIWLNNLTEQVDRDTETDREEVATTGDREVVIDRAGQTIVLVCVAAAPR